MFFVDVFCRCSPFNSRNFVWRSFKPYRDPLNISEPLFFFLSSFFPFFLFPPSFCPLLAVFFLLVSLSSKNAQVLRSLPSLSFCFCRQNLVRRVLERGETEKENKEEKVLTKNRKRNTHKN